MAEPTVPMVYVRQRELPLGASREVVGLGDPKQDKYNWGGEVATKITDYGLKFSEGMKGSIDAAGMVVVIANHVWYRLRNQESPFADVFRKSVHHRNVSNFTNTLVNYDDHCDENGVELESRKGFVRASVIHNPKDFKYNSAIPIPKDFNFQYNDNGKTAVFEADEDTRILRGVYVPESGFMVLTEKGFLNPLTGFPYRTVGDKGEAVYSFTSRGVPKVIAEFIVSSFLSRGEDKGIGGVERCYIDDYVGRFTLYAGHSPDDWNPNLGRLRVSRRDIGVDKI